MGLFTLRAALVAALIGTVFSSPIERKTDGLDVKLAQLSETEITATVTNTADETLSLLNFGTFMDDDLIRKVTVTQGGAVVPFHGIIKYPILSNIPERHFTTLAPGETYTSTINLPAVHLMEDGGEFEVNAKGSIKYAVGKSTTIVGAISYKSNILSMKIAPAAAKSVERLLDSFKTKRSHVQECTSSQTTIVNQSLKDAAAIASQAATAAASGSATKFQEYFKTTASNSRSAVAARLNAIATEAAASPGKAYISCTDKIPGGYCDGTIAYADGPYTGMTLCPYFFSIPATPSSCHGADRPTVMIHEFSHLAGIYSPGTEDLAYEYDGIQKLSSAQSLNNADNFELYANAVALGC